MKHSYRLSTSDSNLGPAQYSRDIKALPLEGDQQTEGRRDGSEWDWFNRQITVAFGTTKTVSCVNSYCVHATCVIVTVCRLRVEMLASHVSVR